MLHRVNICADFNRNEIGWFFFLTIIKTHTAVLYDRYKTNLLFQTRYLTLVKIYIEKYWNIEKYRILKKIAKNIYVPNIHYYTKNDKFNLY